MFGTALDRRSELDLLAVAEAARGNGLGTLLVNDMEAKVVQLGVRVWLGNVTADNGAECLQKFYSELDLAVFADGQALPPLLGKRWVPPFVEPPASFLYKLITSSKT